MNKETVPAQWYVSLNCTCPHCGEWIDLMDNTDFFEYHRIDIPEHDTDRTTDMEVNCPTCYEEFNVDLIW